MNDLYPEDKKWSWDWDFDSNRNLFEKNRILSDQMKLAAKFGIGALVINHIVSSIDAMYLKRISSSKKADIIPYLNISKYSSLFLVHIHKTLNGG